MVRIYPCCISSYFIPLSEIPAAPFTFTFLKLPLEKEIFFQYLKCTGDRIQRFRQNNYIQNTKPKCQNKFAGYLRDNLPFFFFFCSNVKTNESSTLLVTLDFQKKKPFQRYFTFYKADFTWHLMILFNQ